jgi:hypothetical protein
LPPGLVVYQMKIRMNFSTMMLMFLTLMLESSFHKDFATAQSYQKASFEISAKNNRYLKVGTDRTTSDEEIVYLDKKSIKKVKRSVYKYTVAGDLSRKNGFEFDLVVNCRDLDSIMHISQRYYVKGRLFKTERLGANKNIQALRDSGAFPEYESNVAVCNIIEK